MKTLLFLLQLLVLSVNWYFLYFFFINIIHIKSLYSAIFSTIIIIALFILLLYKNRKSHRTTKNYANYLISTQDQKNIPSHVVPTSPKKQKVENQESHPNVFYSTDNYLEGDEYYVRINLSSPDFFHSVFPKSKLIRYIKKGISRHRLTKEEIILWKRKRANFEEMKTTHLFKSWKRAQFNAQDYKCAWCKCTIQPGFRVETDHIQPLYYGGENSYNNFVLTCHHCNQKKGKSTCGWGNDGYDGSNKENYKPTWIKTNPVTGF